MRIKRVPIGLRTIKTAAAIIIAMVVVDLYGATASRLIFAMLGAMAAVQPTFRESVEACLSDILGVIFGALAGVLLSMLPISHLAATGIGVILIITLYNMLHVTISPSLPCFILVMLCTTPDIAPVEYALGRIWDTAIGLGVGMAVNMLVFPYDNSRQIRSTIESLDRDLILFLEELFDGDEALPTRGTYRRSSRLWSGSWRSLRIRSCSFTSAGRSGSWSGCTCASAGRRSWWPSSRCWPGWGSPAG